MYHVSTQGVDERMVNVHYHCSDCSSGLLALLRLLALLCTWLQTRASVSAGQSNRCERLNSSVFHYLDFFSKYGRCFKGTQTFHETGFGQRVEEISLKT